ncbi:hypothetical protein M0R04_10425 [Candidatus Dojkabacteria bacterium]|jgi:hypothetical protein|nr:hypothetical protein [Candidatus Dojkabacteria bacterium]
MLNKIKELINRKRNLAIINREAEKQLLYDHLIAIARLSMITPKTLFKEARNVQSNAEYLMRMAEEMKK